MKNLMIASLVAFSFACSGPKNSDGFIIKGTIKGLSQNVVYLERSNRGNWQKIDSASVDPVKGKFELKGKLEAPEFLYICSDKGRISGGLFVENANLEYSADSIHDWSPKVTGSKSDAEFRLFSQQSDSINKDLLAIDKQYSAARKANDTALLTKLDHEYDKISDSIDQKFTEFKINYVKKNNKSFVSPEILLDQLSYAMGYGQLDSLVREFDTTLNKSVYIKALNDRIAVLKSVAIGQPAPDFTMNDSLGNPVKLSSLFGKYLLIDFWASWCGPCRRENPNVVAAYKEFSKKGFDILGVSLDKDKSRWTTAIKKDNLSWHHVSDLQFWNNAAAVKYGINSIPSNVLLDPKGIIIGQNLRGDELKKKLKELLK